MHLQLPLLIFSIILLPISNVLALHFYASSGERKCFYETLREGNVLVGDIDGYVEGKDGQFADDSELLIGISIYEMFDNDELVLHQQNLRNGDFTFRALETGKHKICINPIHPKQDISVRMFVELDILASDALDSKRKGEVKSLQERISQLMKRLNNISDAQRSIREEEAMFRDQSESANSRIAFWSILQIVALVVICVFQLRYLKNFLIKQKII